MGGLRSVSGWLDNTLRLLPAIILLKGSGRIDPFLLLEVLTSPQKSIRKNHDVTMRSRALISGNDTRNVAGGILVFVTITRSNFYALILRTLENLP